MKFRKILKYFLIFFFVSFIVLLVARYMYLQKQEATALQVEKIHNTKLQLSDVMGDNLPPDPGELADATVEGVDANNNGIRDDVELAIFREYPNSAKTRAVLLQYALALQMQVIQPFVNEGTATEVLRENSRSRECIADALVPRMSAESDRSSEDVAKIFSYINYVEDLQFNNKERQDADNNFYEYLRSYSESKNNMCDIDYSTLPN